MVLGAFLLVHILLDFYNQYVLYRNAGIQETAVALCGCAMSIAEI